MRTLPALHALLLLPLLGGCAHHEPARPPPPTPPPASATPAARAGGASVPLLPGLGKHHRAISTTSPAAQRYFDQGLRLTYAFNHDEARRSFEEAARRDPACAICYWGAALVLGPNINAPTAPDKVAQARALLAKARAAPHASPVERALIDALGRRYPAPPAADPAAQAAHDRAYAAAMRRVARRFPDDDDVQVLFAESLMDLRPWRLWNADGTPAPGTDEIVATLERVLARNPRHPGANHYYIHAVEASPHPACALAAAGRLAALMPGAGHLVHMPSHIYDRVGRYDDAAEANRRAIAADRRYLAQVADPGEYAMYVAHNYQFLWHAAMMAGRSGEAVQAAREMRAPGLAMVRHMPEMAFVVPAPQLALVRFGRWQEALAEPEPGADLPLARLMYTYARARAHAGLGQYAAAEREVAALTRQAAALPEDAKVAIQAPARTFAAVARDVAAGDLACRRGRTAEGLARLRAAVAAEDTLPYDEPPNWYYPARHTLGACLLRARRPAEAEAVYRADLARHPDNGWALTGLRQSLRAQGRPIGDLDARIDAAWIRADTRPAASDF